MLESLHPLVAQLVARWDTMPTKIDLPKWQSVLQRLAAFVQAKRCLPGSYDTVLNEWLRRNLRRLERLPQELVKQLHASHPLIAAKVRAVQEKHVKRAGLKRRSR